MRAKEFIPASKPRNLVAKNAPTSGAGKHKDSSKKKDQEQGKVKHKKDLMPMEAFSQAAADKNKLKYQKTGRVGHGLDWKNYGDDYKTLINDIVDKFDNITRLVQYLDAPEPTKYKIVERFFKKYGYPFELFNDVITAIEKRAAGETARFNSSRVAEATSAAVRMQRAADRQRAKSDASLARTPSSIPKKEEPKKQGVAEVSDELRNKYVSRASDDYSSANFAARASKSHPGLDNYSREQEQRAKKRAAGLNRALSDKRLGKDSDVAIDKK